MSKLSRREFKELLTGWKQNFIDDVIVERGLPHERLGKYTLSKKTEFNSLREKSPFVFPITYITIKSSKENDVLFKKAISNIRENKSSDSKLVLQNNEANRSKVANELKNADLVDSKKYNQII